MEAFTKYQLNVNKVFSGLFYNTKPLTNYQKVQLITLLHEDKLGKNQKSKSQSLQTNLVGVAKIFATLAKFSQGLRIFATPAKLARLLQPFVLCFLLSSRL